MYHEADELLTRDGWLREVVNRIGNPNPNSDPDWWRVRRLVTRFISSSLGIAANTVVIPISPDLPHVVPHG
jgi:hypothetical protein